MILFGLSFLYRLIELFYLPFAASYAFIIAVISVNWILAGIVNFDWSAVQLEQEYAVG